MCNPNQSVTIHTDSQCSIDVINRISDPKTTNRQRNKLSNSQTATHIVEVMKTFNTKPILNKVAAHTGLRLNDRADELAKEATLLHNHTNANNLLPASSLQYYTLHSQNEAIEQYPGAFIKHHNNNRRGNDQDLIKRNRQFLKQLINQILNILQKQMLKKHLMGKQY